MTRTLNQQMGDAHEADIAEWIGGVRTKGSGNQWHNQMDAKNGLRTPFPLAADGKSTLGKSIGITRELWQKFREQTFGEIPAMFQRWYRSADLRTVELDLVTLEVGDFLRILSSARQWEEHQEAAEKSQVRLNRYLDKAGTSK
jgi:hypothetical protein